MVLYKYKRGNVTVVLFLCIFVALVSIYMIYNTLQLKMELKLFRDGYQEEMLDASINQVCADNIINILDGRTFSPDEQVLTSSDLDNTKTRILELTNREVDLTINSPTADSLSELRCTVEGMVVTINNFNKTYNTDDEGNLVSIIVDTDSTQIDISKDTQDN